jgi:GAF domain-containing protein
VQFAHGEKAAPEPEPEPEPEPQPQPQPATEPTKPARPPPGAAGLQVEIPGQADGDEAPAASPSAATSMLVFARLRHWATRATDGSPRGSRPQGEAAVERVRRVLDEIVPVLHPGRAVLYLVDKEQEVMLPMCTIGLAAVECTPHTLGIGIAGEAALSGLASIVPAADHDHRFDALSDIAAAAAADSMEVGDDNDEDEGVEDAEEGVSVLCLPLFSSLPVDATDHHSDSEQVRAVLQLANSNAHPFQSSDLQLAGHLCAGIGDLLVAEWEHVLRYIRAIPPAAPVAPNEGDRAMLTIAPQPKAANSSNGGAADFKKAVSNVILEQTAASLMSPGANKGGEVGSEEAEPDLQADAVGSACHIIANVLRVASDMVLVDQARFFVVCHSTSQLWPAYFHNKTKPDSVDAISELSVNEITPRPLTCDTAVARCALMGKPSITSDDDEARATDVAETGTAVQRRARALTFAARPASPDQEDDDTGRASPPVRAEDGQESEEAGGTALCAPLFCRGTLIGVLHLPPQLVQQHPKLYDEDDLQMVEGLCTDVSTALAEGTSPQKLLAVMLALAKQHTDEVKNMQKILGAASVSRSGHAKRRSNPRNPAPSPRARSKSGLSNRSASVGHSGLWGLGSKESEAIDNLTELRNRQYSEGMLWRQISVAGRAVLGTAASRSDAAFAFAVAWYCVALPLHLAFADGSMEVQRITEQDLAAPPPPPPVTTFASASPTPSAMGIGLKTAIVRGLNLRASTDPSSLEEEMTTASVDPFLESWLFIVVTWLDFFADLAVGLALFKFPKLARLLDVIRSEVEVDPLSPGFVKQQDHSRQLHVRGIGAQYESEEALIDVFSMFGTVDHAIVRHRVSADGETNTSWAIVTMATPEGKQAALNEQSTLPDPITVASFSTNQAAASKGAMAHAWGSGLSDKSLWHVRLWRKSIQVLTTLWEVAQSCVAPARYGKNEKQALEGIGCICALPLGMIVPSNWVTTVRLLRLIHVPRGASIFRKWVQQAALHYAVVNILRAIVFLVLLSHWLGCGFLWLLRDDPHASEWMPAPCYVSAIDQYICGVYWAFGTLTSNISFEPHSGRQRVLTIVAWCGGLVLYGSILSSLVSTLANLDRAASAHREHMDALEEYVA